MNKKYLILFHPVNKRVDDWAAHDSKIVDEEQVDSFVREKMDKGFVCHTFIYQQSYKPTITVESFTHFS